MTINRLYGTLMLGELLEPGNTFYRFSNFTPSDRCRAHLLTLVPSDIGERALFTEYVIKLMSCSSFWGDFIREKDPNNTYAHTVVEFTPDSGVSLLKKSPIKALSDWVNKDSVTSDEYPSSDLDPLMSRILAQLYTVCSYD